MGEWRDGQLNWWVGGWVGVGWMDGCGLVVGGWVDNTLALYKGVLVSASIHPQYSYN